jgi:hypothetical protein
MTESAWGDRWTRALLLARAPWLFAKAQSYRQALFKGMLRGEILVQSGVQRFVPRPNEKAEPLRLVLRPDAAPAATLLVSTIAFDADPTIEGRRACAVLRDLLGQGLTLRLIAVEQSSFPHEARVRAWLQAEGGLPPSAQASLEIIDGTEPFVPVGAADLFLVAAEGSWVERVRQRLTGRASKAEVHVLPPEATAAEPWAAAAARLAPTPLRFAEKSRLGLGYRLLKPLADSHAPGRTCLFVHFDPDGRIDPHVLRYLSALKACGLDTVLISSGNLTPEAFAAAEPLTVAAIARENKGLDFSGWALALELFPRLLGSQSLLIANDSVYGPVGDLKGLFERMEAGPFDVWGAIESRNPAQHIQSWFVNFRGPVLQSEAFAAFWSGVLPLDDKRAVIHQYEIPLWRTFEAAGFRVGAAVGWEGHELINNPSLEGWRALLGLGMPFVKVLLLRDNLTAVDLDGWAAELRERGYPAELVVDHLYRVKGPGAAALGAE